MQKNGRGKQVLVRSIRIGSEEGAEGGSCPPPMSGWKENFPVFRLLVRFISFTK